MLFARFLSLFMPESTSRRCEFHVPDERVALLVWNGVPTGFHPPGPHVLPGGKVEVRLILPEAWVEGGGNVPALGLPFERSLLYVDGALVAILRPSFQEGIGLTAWEGVDRGAEAFRNPGPAPRAPSRFRRLLGEACQPFPALRLPARSR